MVGVGSVTVVGAPTNPKGAGKTLEVHTAPLDEVVVAFRAAGRDDLADLYLLAANAEST